MLLYAAKSQVTAFTLCQLLREDQQVVLPQLKNAKWILPKKQRTTPKKVT